MKDAKNVSEFPTQPHYAIITFQIETVHESTGYEKEGDYGTRREVPSFKYSWTESEDEWREAIDTIYRFSPDKHCFKAIKVGNVAAVTIKVEVN